MNDLSETGNNESALHKDSGAEVLIRNKVNSKYTLIDITFSYYCVVSCKHCMFDCTPYGRNMKLEKEEVFTYIDQAIDTGRFCEYSFGEQEIFFDINRFIETANYLRSKVDGALITTSTSSIWVKNYKHAYDALRQLMGVGLHSILISIDDYHLAHVPMEKIIECTRAALDIGLAVSLQTIIDKESRRKSDFIQYFKRQMPDHNIDEIDWVQHNCTPVGRGASIEKSKLLYESIIPIGDCSILEILYIDPSGNVTPCCGAGSVAKYLTIGNVQYKSLSEIVEDAETNPFINMLFVWLGPYGLYKILELHGKTHLLSQKHTGACHLCYEIFNNREVYEFLCEKLSGRANELRITRCYVEQKYSQFRE